MPRPAAPPPGDLGAWLRGGTGGAAQDGSEAAGAAAGAGEEGGAPGGPAETLPVVYVSFGASFLAPESVMRPLAAAIAALSGRARFLVRAREPEAEVLFAALDASPGGRPGAGRLLVAPRVPQNDVLGHPSVAAFVTQGGYLSVQEAAYHGVPVGGGGEGRALGARARCSACRRLSAGPMMKNRSVLQQHDLAVSAVYTKTHHLPPQPGPTNRCPTPPQQTAYPWLPPPPKTSPPRSSASP